MTITYQANLDDVAEPSIRLFLRSKTAKVQKIRTTLIGAVTWLFVWMVIARYDLSVSRMTAGAVGAAVWAGFNFFTYDWRAKRRIKNHFGREMKGLLPVMAVASIEENNLVCKRPEMSVTFPLSGLTNIVLDDERLEVSFGNAGLCVFPRSAFATTEERERFVAALKV